MYCFALRVYTYIGTLHSLQRPRNMKKVSRTAGKGGGEGDGGGGEVDGGGGEGDQGDGG